MGHQLSRYGLSSLTMGIYIDMARLSKYGGNIWHIFRTSLNAHSAPLLVESEVGINRE